MDAAESSAKGALDFDAVVIGAGFGGLHMMYQLRERGFTGQVVEMGDGVGGTWFWNRYPGARVDVESVEYSFSFSKIIEDEWDWSELMAPRDELEAYANFVTDRLDLRRHIKFETKVTAATWDEASATWTVETDKGDRWTCRFVITAVGCLSAPLEPAIEGLHSFEGVSLYSNRFPKEGFDFTGKRVAIIGTGSSGVQSIPVVAREARHLHVFQRSAAYTIPTRTRPYEPGEFDTLRQDYPAIREAQWNSIGGTVRFGALQDAAASGMSLRKILETPMAERLARLDREGWSATSALAWADVRSDIEANRACTQLYGEMIKRVVKDPETAASLVPHYPVGCKRMIIDDGYFETYNRDNVTLVDLRKGGIKRITPTGIETEQGAFEFDVILYATGFDALTGALNRIDIQGRDGRKMRDAWIADGPRTYLGLQVHGFPNLFTITGPGSPSVLSNMICSVEQHGSWIADCLVDMRARGLKVIEPTEAAQTDWVAHVASLIEGDIRVHETCNSWYVGANIPGKARVYMPYVAGINVYSKKCREIVEAGYEGFQLA